MNRLRSSLAAAVLALAAVASGREAAGQDAASAEAEVEAVVVTARRIGVPVWRVGQDDGSTLILVGHINAVPKTARWRPEELEKVVAQADSVIFPHDGSGSPADIARAVWKFRSIVFLPKGKTLGDYVDADTLARLDARKGRGVDKDYRRFHPWVTAQELLDSIGAEENLGPDTADVVARAVRRTRKKREVVAVVTGRQIIDSYFKAGPAAHVACLQAALVAAEAGPQVTPKRIEDYTRYRIAAVVRSPLERAFGSCWPEGGEQVSTALRADWRAKLRARVGQPGVTLAVVPLSYLAEEGGLLDMFAAEGRVVDGPRWRADGG
jgi:uncharacterized protein YbaP (TraB family)